MTTFPSTILRLLPVLAPLLGACGGRTPLHPGGDGTTRGTPGPVAPSRPAVPPEPTGGCPVGTELCGPPLAPLCFDLETSATHCGTCGHRCPLGIPCVAGRCDVYACRDRVSMGTRVMEARGGNKDGMSLGDLDGDGRLDLIAAVGLQDLPAPGEGVASAYLGNGDGTFVETARLPVIDLPPSWGWYSALADLDRDGILDLAGTGALADSVGVHLGVGDGSFMGGVDYRMGADTAGITLVDVDGDGIRDLVVAAEKGAALGLRRGTGDGSFGALESLPIRGFPRIVQETDWNGDGIPDLIANDDYLHVLLGTGDGSFSISDCATAVSYASRGGSPQAAVVADFDQDGRMDLGIGNGVLFAMSGCNFDSRYDHASWFPLVAADFDGDDLPDLLAATLDGLEVLTSDGQRGFVAEARVDGFSQLDAYAAVAGDLNGDGRIDAVVSGYGGVRVLMNTCR